MKPEKRHLIETLMDEEESARRAAVLLGGGRILRRRRWRRRVWRGFAGMVITVLTVLSIQRMTAPQPRALITVALPPEPKGGLTDAELLAMFPNTPVGLVTLENGKKRLFFPRSSDEKQFMARY
jgi:hypothetical protein